MRIRLGKQSARLHTRADRDSSPAVLPRARVLIHELYILKTVGIDDEGAPAGTAADEVVAGIPDDQSQAVFPREVDARFDVRPCLRLDHVDAVEAERAGIVGVRRRPTRVVREVRPEQGCRLLDTVGVSLGCQQLLG